MNSIRHSRLLPITGLLLGILVWLANNANPPTGHTGAPFNSHCNNCHGGNNPGGFDGMVDISGLPSTIEPNTTYPMVLTMTPTAGSATKGGFQLVVVGGNNANAGNLASVNSETGTEFLSGREYVEHRNGKFFNGDPISWDFNWTSPANVSGNTVKVYFIGNFTNGNGENTGDHPIAFLQTFSFDAPPPVTATITDITNVSCFGGNNGSATVEGGGGIPPYTYLWNNGQNNPTAVNLTAGTYTVTVTGSSGSGSATATATITQPPVLNATATPSGTLTCIVTSVNVTANASGGTSPYSFEWSNGQTGNPAQYTTPGSHSVTVTDNNGCTKVASFTVNANTTPPTAVAGPPGVLTCAQPQTTLNGTGSSTGPNFSYLWTASNGGNIVSGATTLMPVVNAAGTYTLKVTNSTNGCTATASTTVTSSINPPGASATGGTLTCIVTSLTITASSMTPGVTYSWSGPNGFSSNQQNPTVNTPGNYIVTVINPTNGCTSTATAVVLQNTTPPGVSVTGGTLTCIVTSLTISATSMTPNVTYSWSGPSGFSSNQQNPTVNTPGNYTVTVTNTVNGCTSTATAVVSQNITPPGATATVSGPLTCTNPNVVLNGSSPSQPVTFAWSGPNGFTSNQQNPTINTPGNYTLTVTWGVNGCTSTATATVVQNITPPTVSIATPANLNCNNSTVQINATASSQGPDFAYLWTTINGNIVSGATTLTPVVNAVGTYNLLITNTANGCTATGSTTVNQTPPVTATASATNVSCNGGTNGTATVTPGGGAGNFTYAWSNGGNTSTISNLAAGTYFVTVTDGENCTATATATVTQPNILLANASATGETFNGANNGTATAAPTGGTSPYTYLWSNGGTTATIINLAPGNYTVTVTDINACTTVQTVTVNSFNCTLTATMSSTNVTCNGANNGTATVSLAGAAPPVTFAWSNGANTQSVSNLAPGTYSVSIVDGNNCPALLTVSITEPPILSANATATAETTQGGNDGTATAQPVGGTSPYTYLWSTGGTTATITNLAPGNYTVTVTDAKNCTANQTVTVNAFNCGLTANISSVNPSCPELSNGQATAILNGGTLPFTYLWSNDSTTATISNLSIGTYSVTVTDASACTAVQSVNLVSGDVAPPIISCPGNINLCGADVVNYSPPVAFDNCDLNVQIVLVSGLPSGSPFNDGVTTQVFKATDDSGNTSQCSFDVTIFPLPDILLGPVVNDKDSAGVGTIAVTAVGGEPPYVYIWKKNGVFFSNEEDLDSLFAGTYQLTVIDGNGCEVLLAPVTVGNTVGLNITIDERVYVYLYPNPTNHSFRLEMSGLEPVLGQVFTPQGQLVQTIEQADLLDEISVEYLSAGIYYLKLTTEKGRVRVVKWVKAD